ncbi:MAG: hypothetical protein IAE78_06765 [Myxococcus sp.]|nr:hypothetical protein [Myxococcus sp.]
MSGGPGQLTRRPESRLALRGQTPAQVRAELQAARERLEASLAGVEQRLEAVGKWRQVVRKHPALTIGGMFVAGYLLGRLWSRR